MSKESSLDNLVSAIRSEIDFIKKYETYLKSFDKDLEKENKSLSEKIKLQDLSNEELIDFCLKNYTLKVLHTKDIKISYDKGEEKKSDSSRRFYHSGIKKSSFNFGWKVARRFELAKANAEMNNGLLIIAVPYANESKPKSLKIK